MPLWELFPRCGIFQTDAINFQSGLPARECRRRSEAKRAPRAAQEHPKSTSLAQRFPVIFLALITTKMTWLVGLEGRSVMPSERAEPAEIYG